VADHFETIIRGLERKPAIIGHSTGGLLTQILAGGAWPRCRWPSTRPPSAGCCPCGWQSRRGVPTRDHR
jgi:non-heme chloroperoxidase